MEEQQHEQVQEQAQEQPGKKKLNLSVVWLTLGVVGMIWMFRFIFGLMFPGDPSQEKVYYNADLTSLTPAELCSEQGVKILQKTIGKDKSLYFFLLSMEADSNNQLYSVDGWLFSQDKAGNFQSYDLKSVGEHHVEGLEPYENLDNPTSFVRLPENNANRYVTDWVSPEDWIPISILTQLTPATSPLEQRKNEQPIPPSHNYVITLGKNETDKSVHREDVWMDEDGNLAMYERGGSIMLLPGRFIRLDGSSFAVTDPEQLSRRMFRVFLNEKYEDKSDHDYRVSEAREMWMLERE